ncbi:MAG: right-handed parallel beta-helix repeat-containing protein [Candidatus Latescibacterota bacterium]
MLIVHIFNHRSNNSFSCTGIIIITVLLTCVGCGNRSSSLYVSPRGDDLSKGTKDKPLKTVAAAIEKSRKLKPGIEKEIILSGGDYYEVLIHLCPQDSGLKIKAAPGEIPVLYGGRQVTGWEKDGNFFTAPLKGVKERTWDFRSLIVNDRMRNRARLPKEGAFTHLSEFNVRWMSTTGGGWQRKPTEEELKTLRYKKGDLGPWLDVNNAELTIYHAWDESMVGLAGIDQKTQTVKFSNPSGHPPGSFGDWLEKAKTYVVWNIREGMSKPGQWYLDRTNGRVVYWPLPGEDINTIKIIAPVSEYVFKLEKGTRNITLEGLTISSTTTPLVSGGFGAYMFDGAISGSNLAHCRFENLTIKNVGGWGIKAAGDSLMINACKIFNTGAGGVQFNGKAIEISQTSLHDVGLIYPSAIALSGGGDNNLISHNELYDTPYSAICYGGNYSIIESNTFTKTMTVLNDGAAIYFGGSKGIIVRGNIVRGSRGHGPAHAYYMDEKADSCIVENNIAVNTMWPTHNHMTLNCFIRNNVFIDEGNQTLSFPRSFGMTFEKNILIAKEITFQTPTGEKTPEEMKKGVPEAVWPFFDATGITSMSNNIIYSTTGKTNISRQIEYTVMKTIPLESGDNNLFTDPMLKNPGNGDYRFKSGSPALKLGIQPIDVRTAGVTIGTK